MSEENTSSNTVASIFDLPSLLIGALRRLSVPIGMECFYPGVTPPPLWLDESQEHGLLLRDDYPDLFSFADESGNIISDVDWLALQEENGSVGAFSYGDGETTFRIPLLRRVYMRATDSTSDMEVGDYQGDAIRNFTGRVGFPYVRFPEQLYTEGVFMPATADPHEGMLIQRGPGAKEHGGFYIDASQQVPTANENRPISIVRLPVIKAKWF